jgi:phosphotransferase system, enzyme I, PtsP
MTTILDNSSDPPATSASPKATSVGSAAATAGTTDLSRGLGDLACAIGNQMQCDVCSIYRLDQQRQTIILAASVGLRQDCVESLQMRVTEGLCGLVVEHGQPVNIAAHADEHPRFKFFPEAGEDRLDSFLGVPVTDGTSIVGVLVVQTIEPRSFTDSEIRALALAGREMGPVLQRFREQKESK